MIREAERTDKDKLIELYRRLVPNSKKMNVFEEQIQTIKMDPNNFLLVYDEGGEILGTVTLTYVYRLYMVQDHMEWLRTSLSMRIIEVRILDKHYYNMLRSIVDR